MGLPMTMVVDYLKTQGDVIEKRLNELIPSSLGPYQQLFEAARYSLLGGGKRIRPMITLATVQAFSGDASIALTPACTLEFIHTYSLIHDDLPCMDDDDFRRGKPSLHKKYNEGHAVLTGDFLLTYAFEVLATDPLLSAEKKIKLIEILAKRSGSDGMIGGQVMDIGYVGNPLTLEQLSLLHKNKTAALISAAVEFGGIIADANPEQLKFLRLFGENIGLAFQIMDDILDVTSSAVKHGRSVASDIINGKTTYVSLLGVDKAREAAKHHHTQALHALAQLPINPELLAALSTFIIDRQH